MLLGDMGAEVIKVESPGGDDGRLMKPAIDDLSTYFMLTNRNKCSITLNMKSPQGKEILRGLVKDADVVVENFRPGTLDRLGFGYEALRELNPKIILTSITGFGQDGPYAERPAFDSVAQAMGGLMNQTGDSKPVLAGSWIADYGAGLYGAFGTMLALLHRERTGVGQHVDVSLLETVFSWLRTSVPDFLLFGKKHNRAADRNPYRCPVGTFETSDGYIYITATTHEQFVGVCKCAEHLEWIDDPRFCSELVRLDHAEEFCALVTKWTKTVTTEQCLDLLIKADVPCAPINDVEQVLANPQIQARQGVVWQKCHTGQDIPLINVTVKMSETPGSVRFPPPKLGNYNEDYYGGKLGFSTEEIAKLKSDGVI